MTEEKAIELLRFAFPKEITKPITEEVISMSVSALEKQIPKSWIRNEYFDGDYTWECPCCKEEFVLIESGVLENGYGYCPNCGQKLDWEEVEE